MAQRALVIGGGIGGMCAARALADIYPHVTIIERDRYPDQVERRKGVPQSRMFHTLIERGRREIEALFPGFHALLDEQSAPRVGFGFNAAIMTPRGWLAPVPVPNVRGTYVSRVLLEATVRRLLVSSTANLETRERTEVTGLVATAVGGRLACTGVEVRNLDTGESEALEADLVVDASGSRGATADWLARLDITMPAEETLDPRLTYGGQWMRMRPDAEWPKDWWWTHGAFIQRVPPSDNRGAHLMRQEGDLWLLTLVAGGNTMPPIEDNEVAKFVGSLRSPLIEHMLPLFEPVSRMSRYRVPINRWRRFDKWSRSLDGFVAVGDSTCVFNPNQGQGMTAAVTDAAILRRCALTTTDATRLPPLYFAEQAKFIRNPWRIAVANDLRFDSVEGRRSPQIRAFNWYRHQLAKVPNRHVQRRIGEIDGLLEPTTKLFSPLIAARAVATAGARLAIGRAGDFDRYGPMPPEPRDAPRPATLRQHVSRSVVVRRDHRHRVTAVTVRLPRRS